jgi:hypothetical protein
MNEQQADKIIEQLEKLAYHSSSASKTPWGSTSYQIDALRNRLLIPLYAIAIALIAALVHWW